ncbi:MAG: PAS domain S-box protein [Pedobacter sp.]|nr:MAG: PAS domain S-box protein [Pedobacter sp.]
MKKKDKILSSYHDRIEKGIVGDKTNVQTESKEQAVLLGELQIAQLELEMQNDELSMAVSMLKAERAKFESFFNLAPTGYFITDLLGIVKEVNQVGLDLLDISKFKLTEQRLQSFILPADLELFYNLWKRLTPNGNKAGEIIRFLTANGQVLHTQVEGISLLDNFSEKNLIYLTVTDITANRILELERKDTAQRLELTLSASGIGTWSVDSENNQLFLDKYSISLLGISVEEFDGTAKMFFDKVHHEDKQQLKERLREDFLYKNEVEVEFRINAKGGKVKFVMLKGLRVEVAGDKPHLAGIIVDITKNKHIEEVRKQLDSEKHKLVYETTFAAQERERSRISSALHDSICQLLYGIRLNLQNLERSNKLPLDMTNVNELIAQAIKEIRSLSNELTPSVLKDFGLVAEIKGMVERLTSPSLKIKAKICPSVDSISSELQLSVYRIIQELLNNCIKHARATKVEIMLCVENQEIILGVNDNGIGIQSANWDTLKGSGLRAIKNRVQLLNGIIDVQGSSKGTRIRINIVNVHKYGS